MATIFIRLQGTEALGGTSRPSSCAHGRQRIWMREQPAAVKMQCDCATISTTASKEAQFIAAMTMELWPTRATGDEDQVGLREDV